MPSEGQSGVGRGSTGEGREAEAEAEAEGNRGKETETKMTCLPVPVEHLTRATLCKMFSCEQRGKHTADFWRPLSVPPEARRLCIHSRSALGTADSVELNHGGRDVSGAAIFPVAWGVGSFNVRCRNVICASQTDTPSDTFKARAALK